MGSIAEPWVLENGSVKMLSRDIRHGHGHNRTTHNVSVTSLCQKSDIALVSKVPFGCLRTFLANIQEVILGTKLSVLFPAIPLAIAAQYYRFGKAYCFPYWSNSGRIAECNMWKCNRADNCDICFGATQNRCCQNQTNVNTLLLLLALLCHVLLLMFQYASLGAPTALTAKATLNLSRASSILMLFAYFAYLFFQLKTHRQLFVEQEEEADGDDFTKEQEPVIGFWSGLVWLVGMTAVVALLSEYLVDTIESSSESWGISVSFISIILLPIVGNAAEHFGAIAFAFKNKLDITLAVALGSATQIAVFVVPVTVIFAWTLGISMNLGFNLLDTSSLALTVLVTAFTLQDGTSHYLKGIVLLLCYIIIAACFFVSTPATATDQGNYEGHKSSNDSEFERQVFISSLKSR